jgi:DNA-binding NarL/FixJ family response regulator
MIKPVNIAIAEDYHLFRQGIVSMLLNEPGINVIFEAANGEELITKMKLQQPQIVLMDIRMPIMDGKQALEIINNDFPGTRVIILSMHYSESYISEYIASGACSFLPKNCSIEKIIEAIYAVHKQGYYYDDRVSKSLASQLAKAKKADNPTDHGQLTEREIDIVRLLCEDKSLIEIGKDLHISVRTVEWHKKNVFEKTGAKSLAGLAVYAIKQGIVPNPEDLFN